MDCLAPVHCDPCRLQAVLPVYRARRLGGVRRRRCAAAQATRPFPHKNKKGRKKENSSGRAAPQGSPALPARLCVGRR